MDQKIDKAQEIYSNFIFKLNILRKKQFDFFSGLIKIRDNKKIAEIKQEIKKYE